MEYYKYSNINNGYLIKRPKGVACDRGLLFLKRNDVPVVQN